MLNMEIITIFTIFILAIVSKVDALEKGKLDNFKYVSKKGYIIYDIEDFNLNFEDSINNLYKNKSDDELDKLELFQTIDIPTPEMWLEDWRVDKKYKTTLYKKYKESMRIPDPNNNETVYQLLVMSRNAYVEDTNSDWVDITEYGWEILYPFGWNTDSREKTANHVRGYIFKNEKKKVLVISIKGTSAGLFGIGGPTADYDKLNDNMMFSCCCAIVDVSWSKICDCYSGISNTCEMSCLKRVSSTYNDSYYEQLMKDVYEKNKIQEMREEGYDIFITGHSLGGALASLSGLSLYAPVFTFEAPGEEQFARRVGIKLSKNNSNNPYSREEYKNLPIYHFGNNGDPIYTGKCKGITSACYYSGFAMETKCHVGKMYMFDLSKNRNEDPVDGTPGNEDPGNEDPGNDNPDYDDPNIRPVDPPKGNNDTPTQSYSKTKESPVFLINKSSIDEHQFHLFMQKYNEENQNIMNNDVDPSLKSPRVPSNPSKLNMLHHRVDYVISLIKKWEGPWPEEDIQDDCTDCDNWDFIEGDGDEGHT